MGTLGNALHGAESLIIGGCTLFGLNSNSVVVAIANLCSGDLVREKKHHGELRQSEAVEILGKQHGHGHRCSNVGGMRCHVYLFF